MPWASSFACRTIGARKGPLQRFLREREDCFCVRGLGNYVWTGASEPRRGAQRSSQLSRQMAGINKPRASDRPAGKQVPPPGATLPALSLDSAATASANLSVLRRLDPVRRPAVQPALLSLGKLPRLAL